MAPAASNDVQSVLLAIRALGREPVIVQFLQARPSPHSPSGDAIVLPVCVRQDRRTAAHALVGFQSRSPGTGLADAPPITRDRRAHRLAWLCVISTIGNPSLTANPNLSVRYGRPKPVIAPRRCCMFRGWTDAAAHPGLPGTSTIRCLAHPRIRGACARKCPAPAALFCAVRIGYGSGPLLSRW